MPFEPQGFPGFGYLFDDPKSRQPVNGQRSQLGADPAAAHRAAARAVAGLAAQRRLLGGATRSPASIPTTTRASRRATPTCCSSSPTTWCRRACRSGPPPRIGLVSRNLRSSPLMLDTLYGGGPSVSPIAYQRGRILRGRPHEASRRPASIDGRRDRPPPRRTAPSATSPGSMRPHRADGEVVPANFDNAYVTCAADARNDDNFIVAQLTALFANVHNAIAGQRRREREQPEAVFGYAQIAMQRIYHAIVVQDLLPKLLHPEDESVEVSARPQAGRQALALAERPDTPRVHTWRIPRRPRHGAPQVQTQPHLRRHARDPRRGRRRDPSSGDALPRARELAGAMVAVLQDVGCRDAESQPTHQPDPIGAGRRGAVQVHRHGPAGWPGLARPAERRARAHLACRCVVGPHPGEERESDTVRLDPSPTRSSPGCDPQAGFRPSASPAFSRLPQIDKLSDDPPLPFFVLLESALDPAIAGRHLGPLGSIIIGEVIGRTIARERQRIAAMECALKKNVRGRRSGTR